MNDSRRETLRRYRERNKEKVRAACRAWNKSDSGKRIRGEWERARGKEYRRAYYAKKRAEILALLGGHCACCGETEYTFLAIDHVNGGGHKERNAGVTCFGLFKKVKQDPALYRVLCHNCNVSLGRYGHCPHGSLRASA